MRSAIPVALIFAVALSALTAAPAAAIGGQVATAATEVAPEWERLAGSDRYAASISISGEYAAGVPVVYIASGENFPDALTAAPAAAVQGGPLLLSRPTVLLDKVRAEIVRLKPKLIVVAGGPATVSADVYKSLARLAPSIRRDWGNDRYETSRAITLAAFPAGSARSAFVATGEIFPDALTASSAAGSNRNPVVLVRGQGATVDQPTAKLLSTVGVKNVSIAGGPSAVSTSIETAFAKTLRSDSVVRYTGRDRYASSNAVNLGTYGSAPVAYLAKGTDFPDALSGAALAARDSAPMFIVPSNCVPEYVISSLKELGTTRLVLLGGPGSLTVNIENLVSCGTPAASAPAPLPVPPPLPVPGPPPTPAPTPPPAPAPAADIGVNQPFDKFVNVSSHFGWRIHPITRVRTMHNGTDYAQWGILGTPIRAIADGKVVARFNSSLTYGMGNSITILHRDGLQSQTMHMKDPALLTVGATVKAGATIGLVGTTGGSTGPHLHLELRRNGTHIDPYLFLAGAPYAKAP